MKISLAVVAVLTLAGAAQGAITFTAGATTLIASPPVANVPALIGPNAFVWDEQQNVSITSGLACDMTMNPSTSTLPSPGLVVGAVDSHFIHFTHIPNVSAAGDVFFSGQIIGVMFNDTLLDISDPAVGAFGTAYPTGQPNRGMQLGLISINGNHLRFDFNNQQPGAIEITQVRVLTQVPAPGAMALAGLGGLLVSRRRRGGVS